MTSDDPKSVCREELVAAVLVQTTYGVLILPPAPEPDGTGLRGLPGFTEELKQHLQAIARNDGWFKDGPSGTTDKPTWHDAWNLALYRNVQWWMQTNVLQQIRVLLGDYYRERDWYRFFVYCMYVWNEDQARKSIGLPPALDAIQVLTYSTMANCISQGHRYPDLVWREGNDDLIERGELLDSEAINAHFRSGAQRGRS